MQSITELHKMIIGPSDLNQTFHYFFDLIESTSINNFSKILSSKKIKTNPELMAMLKSIQNTLSEFLQQEIKIEKMTLFLISHKSFVHGFCKIKDNAMPIPVLYFSDVKIGAFALTGKNFCSEYFRFTLVDANQLMPSH